MFSKKLLFRLFFLALQFFIVRAVHLLPVSAVRVEVVLALVFVHAKDFRDFLHTFEIDGTFARLLQQSEAFCLFLGCHVWNNRLVSL